MHDKESRENYDLLYASFSCRGSKTSAANEPRTNPEEDKKSANANRQQQEKERRASERKRTLEVLKSKKARQKIGKHDQERKAQDFRTMLEALQEEMQAHEDKNPSDFCWRSHYASLVKTPEEVSADERAARQAHEQIRKKFEQREADLKRDLARHEHAAEAHRQEVIRLTATINAIYKDIKLEKKVEKEEAIRKKAEEEAARKAEEEARLKAEMERIAAEAAQRRAEKTANEEERKRRIIEELLEIHENEEKDRGYARGVKAHEEERAKNRDRMFEQERPSSPKYANPIPRSKCRHQDTDQKFFYKIDGDLVCGCCRKDLRLAATCSNCQKTFCRHCNPKIR